MKDDGSIFPGSMSMNAPQARAMMPQGAAAMILQGPWNIPIWQAENPDFNFNVSSQPLMEPGLMVPLMVRPGGSNQLYVFADAPEANKQIAGDILHYIGTLEGQRAWAGIVGAADVLSSRRRWKAQILIQLRYARCKCSSNRFASAPVRWFATPMWCRLRCNFSRSPRT